MGERSSEDSTALPPPNRMQDLTTEERLEWYFYEYSRLEQERVRILRELNAQLLDLREEADLLVIEPEP